MSKKIEAETPICCGYRVDIPGTTPAADVEKLCINRARWGTSGEGHGRTTEGRAGRPY